MSRAIDFDKDEIITKAMNIFWAKGYDGTSLKDLTHATGLLKGSLYNTFTSKENLFLLCLEKYGHFSRSFFYTDGDPKKYLKDFFNRLINEGVKKENINGCLVMNTCLEFADTQTKASLKSKALFEAVELNFENVVKVIPGIKESEANKHKANLISAAFSIREISKFRKDKKFLKQVANNALKDLNIKV